MRDPRSQTQGRRAEKKKICHWWKRNKSGIPHMCPDGILPHMLRKLADLIARLLSVILDSSWQSGKVLETCRKANVSLIFREDKKEELGS